MATITVTTLKDVTDPSDGEISLREAVDMANQSEGADTIVFDSAAQGLIRLTEGEIRLTEAVTIDGAGSVTITGDRNGDDITISGDITDVAASLAGADRLSDNSRLFNAANTDGDFAFVGLTLTGGRITDNYNDGGALISNGFDASISLVQTTVSGNSTAGTYGSGGALKINGALTVTNSTIGGNSTAGTFGYGGALSVLGAVTVTNSTISGNSTAGRYAAGGGIRASDAVTITNSTISGNSTAGTRAFGGGLYNSSEAYVTIANSTISGNSTEGEDAKGGGLYSFGAVTVSNSIILGNTSLLDYGDEIYESLDGRGDNDGIIQVSGTNIIGSDKEAFDVGEMTTGPGTARNANPDQVFFATEDNFGVLAGALANNGGPVLTIALKEDAANPALDAATITGTDARGFSRGVDLTFADNGGLSDLGAFELQTTPVIAPTDIVRLSRDNDFLRATQLDDTVVAFGGDDTVFGLAGDDLLFGGGGNDRIIGAGGDDRLRGNAGDDTLKGNGGADNIKGNGGADFIKAGGDADTVNGGGGSDTINGGGGNDLLQGGRGADEIIGRGGDDTLKGGGGADTFRFRASDRNDTILDFRHGQDRIEIINGANSFADLSIEQDGEDVLLGFGTGQVRIVTDTAGLFDESDFIF